VCGTLLARADEVIERSGHLFEPRLIDNPGEVGFGSLNETARAVERCAQGGGWD
jgi:hypothetical protein